MKVNMKKFLILFFVIGLFAKTWCQDIVWATPTTISTTSLTASDPRVVMDPSGNVTAAWIENNLVTSSSLPFNGSWTAPTTLSVSGVTSVRLGVDSSGNVTALWIENGVVMYSTLPFGGSWSAEAAVSASGASSPQLAVDSTGNAVAVWIRNGFIESSTKLFGGSWNLTVSVLSNGTSDSPQVAIGANGTVVAVWHSVITGSNVVVSATKTIAGSWGAAVNIIPATAAFTHTLPKVTVDASGNATAIWFRYNLSNSIYQNITIIAASLLSGGSVWGSPAILTQGGMNTSLTNMSTRVGSDTNGNVVAVWNMSYDGYKFNVESAVKQVSGSSWTVVSGLDQQDIYAYQVDMTANNALGDVLATYMAFDGSSTVNILSQESEIAGPIAGSWSAPLTVSQGTQNGYPRVAAILSGTTLNAAVVWIHFDGTSNVIQASFGSRTTVLPPTSLAVTQNSNNTNVFTEYYNTITWTASTSPNLIQYNIFRNGIFFIAVDSSASQFIDHNAIQNGSVTYGVAAEDSVRSQSPIATISFP
jgi:hypothetical protein